MPVITHRSFALFQSFLALLILVQCEKSQPVKESHSLQTPTAVRSQHDERVADSLRVEPPMPPKMEPTSESVSQAQILGEWMLEKKNPTTGELAFKAINVFKKDGIYELHFSVPPDNETIVSAGKWAITGGHINVEYRFGNLGKSPLVKRKFILKDPKSLAEIDKEGKNSDELYTYQKSLKSEDSDATIERGKPAKSNDGMAVELPSNETKPIKALPELTGEQFGRFELNMGLLRNELERGKVYQVIGSIIQVGPDYIQIDDGNSDSFKANPYGVVKVSSEFLENFPGMRGDPVRFLAEFVGYNNFSSVTGRSLRLAVFNASHYSSLSGESIKVIDRDLAQKVITMTPDKVQDNQKMADEGKPQTKSMPDVPNKSVPASTNNEADSVKIKIAELKGELAVINSRIDVERKRWKEASDLINAITNNGTQPVIRNSPEHVRMYEAQVIMKDVEAKAPGLKEQKAKIEETIKALELP